MSQIKQTVATVLVVLMTLTALASVRPGVAFGDEGHDTSTEAPAPTTVAGEDVPTTPSETDTTSTTSTTTPTDEADPDEPTADLPTDDQAAPRTEPTATERAGSRRDPRWIDFSRCPAGFWTCAIAMLHQDQGKYMWRNGKVFVTADGRRVRGHRGHTWTAYRRQARQLVAFLKALERAQREQARRASLVRRWSGVARCESGGRWNTASGNGYYGGLQFSLSTWRAYGGRGYPHQQPAWKQAEIAERLRVRSGLHHWPHCGRYYG